MANELLDAALRYAEMGIAVFPLWEGKKNPIPKDGVYAATTDSEQIRKWWKRYPSANIGIACGAPSGGLAVIDIDTKHGIDGFDVMYDWERENKRLPTPTVRCITPSGGEHIYYKVDRRQGNREGILPAIDIRGDGGYVVAPPSVFGGASYQWEYDPEEYEIAHADETVYKFLSIGRTGAGEVEESFKVPAKVNEGQRNSMLFRLASSLQARGLSDETIVMACLKENELRCSPPMDEQEVRKTVESALKYDKGSDLPPAAQSLDLILVRDSKGKYKVRQCAENMFRVIQQDESLAGKIKYDTLNYRPMYLGQLEWRDEGDVFGEWADGDDAALRSYLDIRYGLSKRSHYDDAIQLVLMVNKYNPLTGYLNALEWDGVHRMHTILPDYLGCDRSDYVAGVTHLFTQGMVHRAYKPGTKFDYALNLVGPQGKGKSTAFKYFACRDEWYDDAFSFRNADAKQTIERMEGKWVLEMGEMALLKKDSVSADALKAFLTSQADKYRVPFDRRSGNRKRSCVFCGTSNDINFLKDRTGNRRFLPVDIHPERATKNIFDEKVAREEFRQVIAEAVHYYKSHPDEPPVLPKELEKVAEEMQSRHLEEDAWTGIIQEYLEGTTLNRVNALCIWVNAFNKEQPDMKRADGTRILTILRNDIKGWHEIGKARCDGYGRSLICFERDSNLERTGFEDAQEDELIPF